MSTETASREASQTDLRRLVNQLAHAAGAEYARRLADELRAEVRKRLSAGDDRQAIERDLRGRFGGESY